MTCCTTPLPAHMEVNCQLISITVPSSSGVMHAYSSPLLLHMFCFPPCLFSFSSHLGRSFYSISRLVWFLLHLLQATPIPGQDGSHYTLVNTYPSTSLPPVTHMQTRTLTHTHTNTCGVSLGARATSAVTFYEPNRILV